jgi:hypothetical protein
MVPKRSSSFPRMIAFLIVCVLLAKPFPVKTALRADAKGVNDTACRTGIDAPLDTGEYDISILRIASLLDWQAVTNPSLPEGVEYIRVLRLRNDLYPQTLDSLPAWVEANPGSVWVIGNEPDTTYENQDALLAEVYADRYYELATLIRQLDPSAKLGFGPVVQPTPIRIRYLTRAWNRLVSDAGNYSAASRLIDIWTPHSFILNEDTAFGNHWGTGVPPGFEFDHDDAFIIDVNHLYLTYSTDIFEQRINEFRTWMDSIGEGEKALWITEYGSLFPPEDPPGGPDYYNVSDELTTGFMLDTFDFMLNANDDNIGMPADGNQLVQRWFWYSLNDHRYHFGGSVYNPDYPEFGNQITQVGQNFIGYQNEKLVSPDLLPVDLSINPFSVGEDPSLVDYQLDITVDNNQFEDATCGQLWIYDGDPNSGGSLIIGPLPASAFRPDYGEAAITAYWREVEPNTEHNLCVVVDSIGIADIYPENNMACYSVYLQSPIFAFLPLLHR